MLERPYILFLICFLSFIGLSQETNTNIVAEIKTQSKGQFPQIEATVSSKTELIKSIRYVLYTFREDAQKNISRTEQTNRLVLQANEQKILNVSSFNINETDKITLMLLIFDEKDKLIGRDRKVVLNNSASISDKNASKEIVETESDIYSGLLRGIITEDTKTKPGRDFFIEFSTIYRLQQINGIEIVKVFERFSLGRSTILEVQVGNAVVHRFFAQPRREYLQDQAKIAIVNVSRYFTNLERSKKIIKQY